MDEMKERAADVDYRLREVGRELNDIAGEVGRYGECIINDREEDIKELTEEWWALEDEADDLERETGYHFYTGDYLDADARCLFM